MPPLGGSDSATKLSFGIVLQETAIEFKANKRHKTKLRHHVHWAPVLDVMILLSLLVSHV